MSLANLKRPEVNEAVGPKPAGIELAGLRALSPICWAWTVVALSAIVLCCLVALSPAAPVYDEGWYLATLPLLQRHGLSFAFLTSIPGPAGPTYTFVYAVVEKLFGLNLPWARFTGVGLLTASSLLVASALAARQLQRAMLPASPLLLGAILIALPLVGVSAGMALTEMPAFFFVCLFLCILFWSYPSRTFSIYGSLFGAGVAGLALGIAILGRQNYLVIPLCLILLVRRGDGSWFRSDLAFMSVVFLTALLVVAPVLIAWGGFVPPQTASVSYGYSIRNGLFGAGYAGVIVLILAPQIYRPLSERWYILAAMAFGSIVFILLQNAEHLPAHAMLFRLGPPWTSVAGAVFAILLAGLGLATIAALIHHLVANFDSVMVRFSTSVALLGLLTNAKVTHQFSSRYVFVFIPFLILALANNVCPNWQFPLRLAIGGLIGAMSLASYFSLI